MEIQNDLMPHYFLGKKLAHQLSIVGLVPFVLLSFACWVAHPGWLDVFVYAQSAYGITILSFLGGIHWGVALTSPELNEVQIKRALIWGVVPSMIAWSSRLNFGVGFFVLMIGFIVAYQIDKRLYVTYQMPECFLVLRRRLTIVVVVALALTLLAVNVRI